MSFIDLSQIQEKELVPGFKVKFIHSENMTLAYWKITAGSTLPTHNHPHEQVTSLISGKFEFNLDGKIRVIEPGVNIIIPSGVTHSGKAITDCYIIDVFYPVREDYK